MKRAIEVYTELNRDLMSLRPLIICSFYERMGLRAESSTSGVSSAQPLLMSVTAHNEEEPLSTSM